MKNKYLKNKIIIIILSVLLYLNGLGLIVAGKKVEKKKWICYGLIYMILEWLFLFLNISSTFTIIVFFICIVHTVIICSEYEELLKKNENKCSVAENETESEIDIVGIPIGIGIADIIGKSKTDFKICIRSQSGNVYEFKSNGETIELFETNGKKYYYGD